MQDKFIQLYDFIDFARANKKYADSTANNLKSAVKIFEKELNAEELKSIGMVEDSIGEIFRSLVIANKNKGIASLNTYKARLLKVIKDYKKYGAEPGKIQGWIVKARSPETLPVGKDKQDKKSITLSNPINTPVENFHKIEIAIKNGQKISISVPRDMTIKEAETIKNILDSLAIKD